MIRDLETSFKTDCFVPLQEDLDISAFQWSCNFLDWKVESASFVVAEYHFIGVRKAASIKRTLFTRKVIFDTDLKELHVIPSIVFRQKHSSEN